jgi:hypothetical protein
MYSVCRRTINAEANVHVFDAMFLKWRENNHRTHEDLQMNTVLSDIKMWNIKYLRKQKTTLMH